jgi:hypothetical protein
MSAPIKPEGAESTGSAPRPPLASVSEWREGFYSKPKGDAGDTTGTAIPTTEPVQGFMDKLIHGVKGKNRAVEMLRSVPRGLANAGNAVVQAGAEIGAAALDAADLGGTEAEQDSRRERAKGVRAVSEEDMNMLYGARSDDPIASFTESAVQGASAMLLFSATGAGVIGSAALTDAVAFNPYEDGLSEMAAQFGGKIPGIGGIVEGAGQLLSVEEQDNFLTSRIKRAVEGGVAGAAFDAVFWSAKKVLGMKAKNVEAVAEANANLKQIDEGTHTPKGATVVARPEDNGEWRLEATQELRDPAIPGGRPTAEVQQFNDEFDAEFGLKAGEEPIIKDADGTPLVKLKVANKGGSIVEVVELRALSDERGLGRKAMQQLTDLADRHNITLTLQASPLELEGARALSPEKLRNIYREAGFEQTGHRDRANMVRRPGDSAPLYREPVEEMAGAIPGPKSGHPSRMLGSKADDMQAELGYDHGPRFADRAEAEAQANTINHTMKARKEAAGPRLFTDEQVRTHVEVAEKLAASTSAQDIERLATGTHFNLHYLGGTDRVKAQIESISEQFRKEIDAAQNRGGTSHETVVKIAKRLARQYGIKDWAERVAQQAKAGKNAHVELLASNMAVEQLGTEMAKLSRLLTMRPHDPALMRDAKDLLGVWVNLTRDVAGINSQTGRNLNILGARNRPDAKDIKFPKESPAPKAGEAPKVDPAAKPKVDAGQEQANIFDSMSDDEIEAALRQFEMAGGNVRNADAVIEGLKVLADPKRGPVGAAIERSANVFINALISGAKTMETIFSSGQAMLFFEYANRSLAGVVTLNPKLAREGADMMYAHFAYARDNMQSAAAAFKSNRSMIDPSPSMYATGGVVNTTISMPGRVAGTIDEFTRVTGYRARMRALAARKARDAGLTGDAFARQVELDVRNSIDAKTGVGINKEAAEWAGIPTLSNPLGQGTWGGDLSNLLAKYPGTKFIIPFIRPGINTFRYVGKASGGDAIRLLFKESRDALTKGSAEEAAVIMTRTLAAGALYSYAWYKVMDGTVTGRGPSNETLRNTWLKNHQPYSVKIGDKYYSYRRMEPWGTFLGLAADAHGVQMEMADQEGTEAEDIGKAVFASLLANGVNKSYMQGLSTFMKAVDDQDLSSAETFLGGVAGGFVPQAVQQFNTDVYYREADGIIEEVMKRTPGYSDNLPPKYNALGEPVMKQGSLWNRNFSIARAADASPSTVEDRLLADHIKISPPPKKFFNGGLDLTDPALAKNGKLPYVRWMELVSNGFDGEPGLRTKLEQLMEKGGEYDTAKEGSKAFPGGERGLIVSKLKDKHEMAALMVMLEEYGLMEKYEGYAGIRGASLEGGQEGVDARRIEYGLPTP